MTFWDGLNELVSLCVNGVSCDGATGQEYTEGSLLVAGGNQHPRKYPRGPFEGHLPWNKGSHWGQTDDLSIFMQVSPSKGFKSNFLSWGMEQL